MPGLVVVTGHNTKLFTQSSTHNGVLIFNKTIQ